MLVADPQGLREGLEDKEDQINLGTGLQGRA